MFSNLYVVTVVPYMDLTLSHTNHHSCNLQNHSIEMDNHIESLHTSILGSILFLGVVTVGPSFVFPRSCMEGICQRFSGRNGGFPWVPPFGVHSGSRFGK